MPTEDLSEFDHVITRAKHQTFKWGILMFFLHDGITAQTKKAGDLRESLKNLWNMHKTDEGFREYFGEESANQIEALLKLNESSGDHKRTRGASAGASGADAKKRKRISE